MEGVLAGRRMPLTTPILWEKQMNEESHRRAGRRESSSFNESHAGGWLKHDLDAGYRMMAADAEREAEAADWVEGTSEAIVDEGVRSEVDG